MKEWFVALFYRRVDRYEFHVGDIKSKCYRDQANVFGFYLAKTAKSALSKAKKDNAFYCGKCLHYDLEGFVVKEATPELHAEYGNGKTETRYGVPF